MPNVMPVFAIALAVAVAGTLLILLGCRLARSEMPGIGTAAWVNLTGIGAMCLVNVLLLLLMSPLHAMLRDRSPADAEQTGNLIRLGLQIPADIAVLALTYSLLLEKLSYRRALVVAGIVAAGLALVVFLATHALSKMMPAAPAPREGGMLREARRVIHSCGSTSLNA
jgi:hypothetical protein